MKVDDEQPLIPHCKKLHPGETKGQKSKILRFHRPYDGEPCKSAARSGVHINPPSNPSLPFLNISAPYMCVPLLFIQKFKPGGKRNEMSLQINL